MPVLGDAIGQDWELARIVLQLITHLLEIQLPKAYGLYPPNMLRIDRVQ